MLSQGRPVGKPMENLFEVNVRRVQFIMGSTTLGLVVLSCIKIQNEQAMRVSQ